ncbi:amino acid adenylation domain-containing protein [Lysinibacillus sp. NPDC096418]|uniref:amino acid adenylation domain-containing protein n=1 Tax=Lysinibacillus sp. NPDC096418 TaxID=3364138 RepID=UPI003829521A
MKLIKDFDLSTYAAKKQSTKQQLLPANRTELLTDEEKSLYQALNQTSAFYPKDQTIPKAFYEAATLFSKRIALSFDGGTLTYQQLNEQSNQIAHMLIAHGLRKGDYVAIVMNRSKDTVISLLGVLKAGAVYVPIDPSYPTERCQYLLNDTGAPFILTKDEHKQLITDLLHNDSFSRKVFTLDKIEKNYSKENIDIPIQPDNLAYIIYTSGSTGKPKGVMLRHNSVINLITDNQRIYNSTEQDVFSQFISYSFDPSVTETFTALFSGARLHMLTSIERVSIEAFADMIKREKITVATVPNAFFTQLATHLPANQQGAFATLKYLSVGGEALMPAVLQKWQDKFGINTEVVNVYGPTECTVMSSYFKVQGEVKDSYSSIPIGKPVANYEMYVVDKDDQLCPINVPGELCIAGTGLADGYLHQPEKTVEVFVPHLFSDTPGKLMYRTGDLVRLLPSGVIEFVGRKDSQIKVRGFRIELGEIEAILGTHSKIQEAVILAKKMSDGNNSLFAFYTVIHGSNIEQTDIREYLASNLPEYMLPERLIEVPKMPLSPTGKIDRKQLAKIDIATPLTSHYDAPENEIQQMLAQAWEHTLGVTRVGIHDNFFHIGGHSLKILEILVQVKKHVPFLKIQDFFQHQTIAEQEHYISNFQAGSDDIVEKSDDFVIKELMEPSTLPVKQTVNPLPMNTVLLTGATGYLGSHVLYDLLVKTNVHIFCLIRQNTQAPLIEKLIESMQYYFGDAFVHHIENRVTVIQGDLGKPALNLSAEDERTLSEKIDAIIHCGADVRHFGEATHFNDVNVEGTKYLLEIAKRKAGVHFHHVSTIGIPEELAASQWEYYKEHNDFDYNVSLENVYNQSKLDAENLVRSAVNDQVPVSIYRVGNLTCHSETGKFQRNMDENAFYRMIKSMLYLGKTPKAIWHIDFTPINYASQALVAIAHQPKASGHIFHLCNPVPLAYLDFIEVLKVLGYELEITTSTEYEDWLLNGDHPNELHEYLSLAIAQLEGEGASDSPFIFNSDKTQDFLATTDVVCTAPDSSFIRSMIKYGIQTGYFPEPKLVGTR